MTVPVTAERGARLAFTVGDSTVHTASAAGDEQAISFTLGDGDHTIVVTATDAAGNTSPTAEFTATIDTTPPEVPVVAVDVSTDAGAKTSMSLAGESGTDYLVQLTGPQEQTADGTLSGDETELAWLLPNGDYTATTTLTDAAGNTSAPATATFAVELPAPEAPTLSVTSDPGAKPIEVAVTADGAQTVLVSLVGEGASKEETAKLDRTAAGDVEFSVPDGRYSVKATAVDFQGQQSRSVRESDIVVDTQAPTFDLEFLDEPLGAGVFAYRLQAERGAVVQIASETDALTHEFTADGSWQEFRSDVSSGEHIVTVTVSDAFDNETVQEFTAAVTRPFGVTEALVLLLLLAILAVLLVGVGFGVRYLMRRTRGRPEGRGPGLVLPPPPAD